MTSVELPKSTRFHGWAALFVFSIVALGAHASALGDNTSRSEKWVLSVICFSFILSFFAVAAHFVDAGKEKFIGKKMEASVASFLLVFWAAGLVTIMNPELNIAVTNFIGRPSILNSNLYFSSWISFALIMLINGNLGQEAVGQDILTNAHPKTTKWYALAACSLVMLASSISFHQSFHCKSFSTKPCNINKFAISLGVLGGLTGMGMSYLTTKKTLTILHEVAVSMLSFIFFTFGLIFITFGSGPGTTIGNLYFSTWLGFIVSFTLISECGREFMEAKAGGGTADVEVGSSPATHTAEENAPTEGVEADK